MITDGYYVAAWEGRDFDGPDTLGTAFILHLSDGSTSEVTYLEVTME